MVRKLAAALALVALSVGPSWAFANESITTQQYTTGQQVQASDLSLDQEAGRNWAGVLAYVLLNAQNALPANNPLAIVTSNSAKTITIGGGNEVVLAQDPVSLNARVMDNCPFQSFTIPNNTTGATRTDTLALAYSQIQSNGHNVSFADGSVRTVYNALEGCSYDYATGTTTQPIGYVSFATIACPNNFTTSSQCTITYLFKTVAALLGQELGGVVSSFNGGTGSVTLSGGLDISVTNTGGGTYSVAYTGPTNPVTSVNSQTGAVTVVAGTGESVSASSGSVTVTNTGVTAFDTFTGAVTLSNGAGISINNSSNVVTVTNTGVTAITGGTGISMSGSTGSVVATNTGVTSLIGGGGASVSSGTGAVTLTALGGYGGEAHLEYATCGASTTATGGSWYCTATFAGGAAFANTSYHCATGFVTGTAGSGGQSAATAYIPISTTTVDLYQNQTSGGTVTALCYQ